VVWTQRRQVSEDVGDFRMSHSLGHLFSANAQNIVLVKLSFSGATSDSCMRGLGATEVQSIYSGNS